MKKSFNEYDKENPEIWEKFKFYTFKTIQRGFSNYSAKGIFEIIRWHSGGDLKSDGFKINNIYTPDYSRKFESLYPDYKDFFRKRTINRTENE